MTRERPAVAVVAASVRGTRRPLQALWAASVLGGLGQSLAGTAGALLARQVGGSDAVAGLPQALLVAGAAVAALVLSSVTVHRGRGAALSTGAAVAFAGCVLVASAAALANLPLVLLGSLLLGAGNTAVMLGRYAAADLGPETSRARAMASVLVATTVGAVAGPNLLGPASGLAGDLGLPALAGPYLVAAISFAAAAITLAIGLRRGPVPSGIPAAVDVPKVICAASTVLGRQGLIGLAVLGLANLVMVAVMTMAPVQLGHLHSGLAVIGLVVSVHIAGMFAPSPVSAWLTARIGAAPAAAGAGITLIVASALAAAAQSPAVLAVALLLLGVGWNIALVSGSALLTAGVPSAQRPRREGWGEVGMGVAAAGGGAASGPTMAGGSYAMLATGAAVIAAVVVPLAFHGSDHRGRSSSNVNQQQRNQQ